MGTILRDVTALVYRGAAASRAIISALIVVFVVAAPVNAHAGPWRANEGNTRGWMLMSPAERIEHQAKIRSFTEYDECHAYQLAHHRLMRERAARKELTLPEHGRDFCAHLKQASGPDD
jgi:hypothetical protein